MFQVENLFFSVALADFAKNTTGNGISVIVCDFRFPTLFRQSGCRWGRHRLENRAGPFLRTECVGSHSDAQKTPDVSMCLLTCGICEMPAFMCCRAAFVCVDNQFCGLPFKRFVPESVAQEKAFKVMDGLDAQARIFAVLFLRCFEHGAM